MNLCFKQTPGPGTYRVTAPDNYKCRKPAFSMGGRNFIPGDTTRKPGPGAHYPENVSKFKLSFT